MILQLGNHIFFPKPGEHHTSYIRVGVIRVSSDWVWPLLSAMPVCGTRFYAALSHNEIYKNDCCILLTVVE